jgi:hypothetical protein
MLKEHALVLFFIKIYEIILTSIILKGFGIYFTKNEQVHMINFDIISDDLQEKGYQSVRGFRLLQEQEFFKGF